MAIKPSQTGQPPEKVGEEPPSMVPPHQAKPMKGTVTFQEQPGARE